MNHKFFKGIDFTKIRSQPAPINVTLYLPAEEKEKRERDIAKMQLFLNKLSNKKT